MSEPIPFSSSTPHLRLPMLVPGQAQKEFFVNQALGILDALQSRGVSGSLSAPPALAAEGDAFRVESPATQAWQGRDDHLAVRIGGAWHFVAPQEGMCIFDKAAGYILVFRSGWQNADAPPEPVGGTAIDTQARAAINQLVQVLKAIGILA